MGMSRSLQVFGASFKKNPQKTPRRSAGFKGGQTGQLPRASTTKGPPEKNSKNYYLRKHKNHF